MSALLKLGEMPEKTQLLTRPLNTLEVPFGPMPLIKHRGWSTTASAVVLPNDTAMAKAIGLLVYALT